jgi:hypothetical protein
MQLDRIRARIEAYRKALPRSPHRHVWDVQANFQREWNLEAGDLAAMFDRSLQSPVNRRLWSREHYQPKVVMGLFLAMEPEQVRLMFRDLFRDEKDLRGRIHRFIFLADELLAQYREEGRRPRLAGHDQDVEAACLYLAMRFPEQYAPYDHPAFLVALRDFRVRELPVQPDPERWSKVARTLNGLLRKDQDFMDVYHRFLGRPGDYPEASLLPAWDFVRFTAAQAG